MKKQCRIYSFAAWRTSIDDSLPTPQGNQASKRSPHVPPPTNQDTERVIRIRCKSNVRSQKRRTLGQGGERRKARPLPRPYPLPPPPPHRRVHAHSAVRSSSAAAASIWERKSTERIDDHRPHQGIDAAGPAAHLLVFREANASRTICSSLSGTNCTRNSLCTQRRGYVRIWNICCRLIEEIGATHLTRPPC